MKKKRRWRGLNAFDLKLFMAALMVLDHLDHIPGLLSTEQAGIFHVLTRCVSAWFAFAAVEGFLHTRDRVRYNLRLFLWAGGMALGNLFYNHLGAEKGLFMYNNIFLTLAMGVLALNILAGTSARYPAPRSLARIAAAAVIAAVSFLIAEGGIILLPLILIFYSYRKQPRTRNLLCLALSIALFALLYQPYPTTRETLQMLALNAEFLVPLAGLPFVALYNGKRGPNTPLTKHFFYIFYPLHLWIIGVIALLVAL